MSEKAFKVEYKEGEGGPFPYVDFGSRQGRVLRLWLSKKIPLNEDGWLVFPVHGVDLIKTEKGTLVLRPGAGSLYQSFVGCGYRGGSMIKVLEPQDHVVYSYSKAESPRGALGVSQGVIIWVPQGTQRVKTVWFRTGRLYGRAAEGVTIFYPDGRIELFEEDDPDDLKTLVE